MENHRSLVDTAESMLQAVALARQALVHKENFKKFSASLEKTAIFLQELSKFKVKNSESVNRALEGLQSEVEAAKQLAAECSNGNKIYLLLSGKKIVEKMESTSKSMSRAMALFPLASLDVSPQTNQWLLNLCKNMEEAQYHLSPMEEEILHKIETGVQDRTTDRSFASNLLLLIAESLGIPSQENDLKEEFENFKNDIQSRNEALRMEQIILLLENADVVTTPKEKEMKYFTKRNSLGRQLLEPLQSFYCPITADIMRDPVETSSGYTFEREAIEKWLALGNGLCPLTKTPLTKLSVRPNRTLRQSIEEWKNRNIMITIASMKPEIQSRDEEQVLPSLKKLSELCEKSELHREWVVMEDYIPIVTALLHAKNSEIRLHALAILCSLAKDSDDNKEAIANVKDSITYVVYSLARKVEESMLALQLILELSRIVNVRNLIGDAQGGILLLVTLANSDDAQASKYAQELLDTLAFLDQNVVRMARAKFFGPLLQRLFEGSVAIQVIMADTLADLELTDHDKQCLSRGGALKALLQMLELDDIEVKSAAVRALENLSGVAPNGLQLIKQGAKTPLFELLFCHAASKLRLHVAKTIMHLAMSTASMEASEDQIRLMETEEDIFKLFSLVSYTGPEMQETLLLTFHALCRSPSGLDVRRELRQISAVKILVHLCELDDLAVRANAVKLLCYLTEDGDHQTFEEHVNRRCITTLIRIIKTSDSEDEKAAAMGIISRLPHNSQMSQDLSQCGALEVIFDCLKNEKEVVENAAEALCRFTATSNLEQQKRVAEAGIIPVLVKLLASGAPPTKRNAAISLKQLSESSSKLTIPVKTNSLLSCCFAPSEGICAVHLGICSTETSFCLLEAGAVRPLVMLLGEQDASACEASLDAILTLIEGVQLQNGCKVLEEAGAIVPIIKLLTSSCSSLQEKTLGALQRIFRLVDFKTKYGKSAQMSLVDITQRGSSTTKSLAAKILAQLNVLNEQSSFFDGT
ncbi:U-box domain-containing protein 43-like [Salvia miltiorrhiza]|uniref:U-box domain-containing protein 43-like n=1 Tax=Salvia miltiorrhiza TaxID=226208 RepID=UPI0025AD9584|nr:U-box domain-containing protein 43-like [Salvia miltiorrhiza]